MFKISRFYWDSLLSAPGRSAAQRWPIRLRRPHAPSPTRRRWPIAVRATPVPAGPADGPRPHGGGGGPLLFGRPPHRRPAQKRRTQMAHQQFCYEGVPAMTGTLFPSRGQSFVQVCRPGEGFK